MTNERLMFEVGRGLQEANRLLQAGWKAQRLTNSAAVKMRVALGEAWAAALELERRTENSQPSKAERNHANRKRIVKAVFRPLRKTK